MSMARDPYKYFRVESREILEQIGKSMIELEKGAATPDLVQRLLRFAHTLKGAARVVKQKEIADDAHAIEDALGIWRNDAAAVPERARVDKVFQLLDAIGARVATLGQPPAPIVAQGSQPAAVPVPQESLRTLHADVEEMDALIDGIAEAHVQLAALRRGVEPLTRLRHLHEVLVEQLRPARASRATGMGARSLAIVEEMRGILLALGGSVGLCIEQVDRELRQVREAAERLRLLPVELLFNVLERTARDAAQSLGKRVRFEARGAIVRLDAQVLSVVQNALVQIVRNGVAHGIESEAERAAAGKAPEGNVTLEVSRHGNRVSFLCRDDGRGVDIEAVRRAAQRKGGQFSEAQQLAPDELIQLLLKGGLSTSKTVTEVSGRGIGLDVVSEATKSLGGEVSVRSEAGQGTSFEIVVPVSLASLDALLVEAEQQTAGIPLDAVRRSVLINAADIAHTAHGDSIMFEGKVVPFAPLARSLRTTPQPQTVARRTWSTVIVSSGGSVAALGVDRLLRTENIVLRPLPRLCPAEPVIAGASLDAQGYPQLVLDPAALVAAAQRSCDDSALAPVQRLPILVIDDSLTTRMLEQSILESAGYEVDVAVSGEEALRKARQKQYSLFLVDVEMPGMDGFEFIERIHADPSLRDIPAILVTSRNAPEDKRRGEEVGARAYIVKSDFDQTELLQRIRQLMSQLVPKVELSFGGQ
jgi:two-component system chemotaxis sensor kinase CheA